MPDMSEVTGRIFASMWKSGRDEFRRTGVLDPTFAIWSRAGKSIAGFRVPFWDNALESQCWEVVRAACVFHDVKILLMLSQAWRADPSSSLRARDSETRREMVLALVVSRVGKFVDLWELVCEIIRSPTGSIAGFDPDEFRRPFTRVTRKLKTKNAGQQAGAYRMGVLAHGRNFETGKVAEAAIQPA